MKLKFLMNEFWIMSWNASVQRSNLYIKNTSNNKKQDFNLELKKMIHQELLDKYKFSNCDERIHFLNIQRIVEYFSTKYKDILMHGYKYGVAQKLLNLYLKYLWSINQIHEPPHCPIDRIIINKLGLKFNWTQINSEKNYKNIIDRIKEVKKKDESIAEWEIRNYQRRLI